MDNQNPSAILGTKKFTSGILIGCAIGLLFTVITGVLSYNYAIKLKYDDYKTKVFADQIQLEKDYKAKLADLDKKIVEEDKTTKELQTSLDGLKKFNELKNADQSKLAHMLSLPISYDFFNAINGDTKFFDFVSKNITYIKNDKYFYIKTDEYDYDGIFNDKKGLSYFGFKPKE